MEKITEEVLARYSEKHPKGGFAKLTRLVVSGNRKDTKDGNVGSVRE